MSKAAIWVWLFSLVLALVLVASVFWDRHCGASEEARLPAVCGNNTALIIIALEQYRAAHSGRYPDDLKELLALGLIKDPSVLVCPSGEEQAVQGGTDAERAANFVPDRNCSYLYLGRGLAPDAKDIPVLVERRSVHEERTNAVLANGPDLRFADLSEGDRVAIVARQSPSGRGSGAK